MTHLISKTNYKGFMLNKTSLFSIIAATIAFIAVPAFAADTFSG